VFNTGNSYTEIGKAQVKLGSFLNNNSTILGFIQNPNTSNTLNLPTNNGTLALSVNGQVAGNNGNITLSGLVTADNGLTIDPTDNVRLGGTLIQNTFIETSGLGFSIGSNNGFGGSRQFTFGDNNYTDGTINYQIGDANSISVSTGAWQIGSSNVSNQSGNVISLGRSNTLSEMSDANTIGHDNYADRSTDVYTIGASNNISRNSNNTIVSGFNNVLNEAPQTHIFGEGNNFGSSGSSIQNYVFGYNNSNQGTESNNTIIGNNNTLRSNSNNAFVIGRNIANDFSDTITLGL
jgi:hypothetical protein